MIQWPNPLTGIFNPLVAWLNKLLAGARKCEPLESTDFRIEFTSKGYYLRPKVTGGGVPGATLDANYKLMAITGLGSNLTPPLRDVLICQEWDKTKAAFKAGSVPVYVAKQFRFFNSVSKEFFPDNGDNVTQTYAALTKTAADTTYGDNFRLATDGTRTELQSVTPRYITKALLDAANNSPIDQCLITVIDAGFPTGVKDPVNADVTHLEVGPQRQWAKYATQ